MRKIFLVALAAIMLTFSVGLAQEEFENRAIVVLDDVLVGHAPSLVGEWKLPVSNFSVQAGLAYYKEDFVPKVGIVAGQEMFYGIVAAYPTREWPIEYGVGLQFPITEWGGLRVDYTWLQIKNPDEIEYGQDIPEGYERPTGELGVGFWADLF